MRGLDQAQRLRDAVLNMSDRWCTWLHADHEVVEDETQSEGQEGYAYENPNAAPIAQLGYSTVGLFRFWVHSENSLSDFNNRFMRERGTAAGNYDTCYKLAHTAYSKGFLANKTLCERAAIPIENPDPDNNQWRLKGDDPGNAPWGTNTPNAFIWDAVGYSCSCVKDYIAALSATGVTSCGMQVRQVLEMNDGQPTTSAGLPPSSAEWAPVDFLNGQGGTSNLRILQYDIVQQSPGVYRLTSRRAEQTAKQVSSPGVYQGDPYLVVDLAGNLGPIQNCDHTWGP